MKLEADNKMPLVTKEGSTALICFNEEKVKTKDEEGNNKTFYRYDWARVVFPFSYESLVSGIIKNRYKDDEMIAIINNYLENPEEGDHTTEFNNMQDFRKTAKEIARSILGL